MNPQRFFRSTPETKGTNCTCKHIENTLLIFKKKLFNVHFILNNLLDNIICSCNNHNIQFYIFYSILVWYYCCSVVKCKKQTCLSPNNQIYMEFLHKVMFLYIKVTSNGIFFKGVLITLPIIYLLFLFPHRVIPASTFTPVFGPYFEDTMQSTVDNSLKQNGTALHKVFFMLYKCVMNVISLFFFFFQKNYRYVTKHVHQHTPK